MEAEPRPTDAHSRQYSSQHLLRVVSQRVLYYVGRDVELLKKRDDMVVRRVEQGGKLPVAVNVVVEEEKKKREPEWRWADGHVPIRK